jgi:glyoxylase-like metal-dependent hydrolase (beta-lactamase superfamily II)
VFVEIVPNVHHVPNIIANPFIIVDADGLTLIDAGLPGSDRKILRYAADMGFSARDIRRIVITHSDTDHVGALDALKRATGARVYASAIEAEAIAKGQPSRRIKRRRIGLRLLMSIVTKFFKSRPVQVDEIITEGQTLPVLGGLQVLSTPGHTPGHIMLYSPSAGVLFVGDSIVSRAGTLVGSIPANTWDQEQAAASVRKQAALGARVVCSGHGPVVTDAVGKMPAV